MVLLMVFSKASPHIKCELVMHRGVWVLKVTQILVCSISGFEAWKHPLSVRRGASGDMCQKWSQRNALVSAWETLKTGGRVPCQQLKGQLRRGDSNQPFIIVVRSNIVPYPVNNHSIRNYQTFLNCCWELSYGWEDQWLSAFFWLHLGALPKMGTWRLRYGTKEVMLLE